MKIAKTTRIIFNHLNLQNGIQNERKRTWREKFEFSASVAEDALKIHDRISENELTKLFCTEYSRSGLIQQETSNANNKVEALSQKVDDRM